MTKNGLFSTFKWPVNYYTYVVSFLRVPFSYDMCSLLGLFRVLYDEENWLNIIKTLNDPHQFKKVHVMNRVQLIDDALSFAYAGDLNYNIVFEMLKYLKHEKDYMPWVTAFNGLGRIGNLMRRTTAHRSLQVSKHIICVIFTDYCDTSHHAVLWYLTKRMRLPQGYLRYMLLPVYHQWRNLTLDVKGFEDTQLRNLVMSTACRNLLKDCTDQAYQLFHKWTEVIDPDRSNM